MSDKWDQYWKNKESPLHAANDSSFYEKLTKEIKFYIGDYTGRSVLELGCGDGSLFGDEAKKCKEYTGVDFSESLINKFKENHEDVRLIQSDILSFLRETKNSYDIIFSYGVLQYFRPDELEEMFKIQGNILTNEGYCVHLGVPTKELKSTFNQGIGTSLSISKGISRNIMSRVKSRLFNKIGYWHSMYDLYQASVDNGFATEITPNMNYYYRVNVKQLNHVS